ncbi:MAG: hypothetical protein KA715_13415 [Xanthomonadaceae bacterium]|nr:hypothetical protein [Xanthomonadaceae bacterium]
MATIPGRAVEFTGDVRFIDIDKSEQDGDPDSDHPVRELLTRENAIIRAYFPDELTEVTSEVTWTDTYQAINFKFFTPALQAGALNRLTVQVVDRSKNWDRLIQSKTKIEQRVIDIDRRIADLARQTGGKAKQIQERQEKIAKLTATKLKLQAVIVSIQNKLSQKQAVISEMKIPVQLGNTPTSQGYAMNVMGGFMFETTSSLGVVPQQQSTSIDSKITRLKEYPKNDTKDWRVEYSWNGAEVNEQVLPQIDEFQVINFNYTAQNLLPSQLSLFHSQVSRIKNSKKTVLWGYTDFKIPVAIDTVAPKWAISSSFGTQAKYAQNFDALSISVEDEIGTLDISSFTATLNSQDIKSSLNQLNYNNGAGLSLSGDLNTLAPDEGDYVVSLSIADTVGQRATPNPKSMQVSIDRTPPVIDLINPMGSSFRDPVVTLNATISDRSPTTTTVTLNGSQVYFGSDPFLGFDLTLAEGQNTLELRSIDAAGNSTIITRSDLFLDITPPQVSISSPVNGAVFQSLSIPVSGSANEPLLYAKINEQPLDLSQDKLNFTGSFTTPTSGIVPLHFEISDLSGNVTVIDSQVEVVTSIINPNLISVMPDQDSVHLIVHGANNAVRRNTQVSAASGFFNSASTTADANGSFTLKLKAFTVAQVTATDSGLGISQSTTITYGPTGGTTLSGVVKDVGDQSNNTPPQPIAGVTVTLSGNGTSVITDASGVFTFTQPLIGTHSLIIDGSTAIQPPLPEPRRHFSKTIVMINVGISANNVLDRPIYLIPTPDTLNVETVDATIGATVTSSDAPGFELDVPANTAIFPTGNQSAPIYARTFPAEFSTVETLAASKPKNIVALEPSGTTFTEPVKLTLPNTSELPPGTDMAILSMNSQTGLWEVDGAATVTTDGSKIITKDGMGIRHFSLVYATPLGPTVRKLGSQDQPGADTFNGALTTSIKLPTYKALGRDVGAGLIYRSSWAKPTVTVSNLFDLPKYELTLSIPDQVGVSSQTPYQAKVKRCAFLFLGCREEEDTFYTDFNYRIQTNATSTMSPDFITAKFYSNTIQSDEMKFTGVPDRSTVSYAFDLKDPSSHQYFSSGIENYFSHYEVHFKELIVGTRTTTLSNDKVLRSPQVTANVPFEPIERQLDQVLPKDLTGNVFVQNETESSYGQGWKLSGVQRIPRTSGDKLMIEEADGSVSSYNANNTISTVYDGNQYPGDIQGAAISNYPYITLNDKDSWTFIRARVDGATPQVTQSYASEYNIYNGIIAGFDQYSSGGSLVCNYAAYAYGFKSSVPSMIELPNGDIYGTQFYKQNVFKINPGADATYILWDIQQTPNFNNEHAFIPNNVNNVYNRTFNFLNNYPSDQISFSQINPQVPNQVHPLATYGNQCPRNYYSAPTYYPKAGYSPPTVTSTGQGSATSFPVGISAGPRPNTIVFAEWGTNTVRMIDLGTNTVSIIAGNLSNIDSGDGGQAIQAGINQPLGVVSDSQGNVYFSTNSGYIRKIDSTGVITTIAGKPLINGQSTIYSVVAPMDRVQLSSPVGLALDESINALYVADSGRNRILKLDMNAGVAIQIAGTGQPGFNGDGIAAIDATLSNPWMLALDAEKNLIVTDSGNKRIRRIVFGKSQNGALAYSPTSKDLSTLSRQGDNSWVRTYRDGTKVFFNSLGLQTLTHDRVGRETKYFYDNEKRVIEILDPTNQSTTFYYSGHYLNLIRDPAGRETTFSYNGAGQLVGVRFPDNSQKHYEYDSQGLMIAETDARNNSTIYEYNEWNRLSSVRRPDNSAVSVNDSTSSTIGNNFTGGAAGTLKQTGLDAGKTYDGIKDAKNVETKFVKDYNGFVTTVVDGAGRTTEIKRNLDGQPVEITRPDNTKVTFIYDPVTRDLLSQTDTSLGATTSQVYDEFGNKISETNAKGKTTTHTFDQLGLNTAVTDALGLSSTVTYNNLGLPLTTTNQLGKTWTTAYDTRGNSTSQSDPMSRSVSRTYDLAGNVLTSTNADGKITRYEYDPMNRLIAVVTPKNERTEYTYLASGELSFITDPLGNVTTFEYDNLGRLTTKTDPLGFTITRQYDLNGNVVMETDPNGNVKTFAYDSTNQLTAKTLPDNVIELAYDSKGNLTQARDIHSVLDYSYDVAGRVDSARIHGIGTISDFPDVTLNFDRDVNGNRTALTTPHGGSTYQYDDLDRLVGLTNHKGEGFSFSYDSASRLSDMSRPGSSTQFQFDDGNFVSSIVHSRNGGGVAASFGINRAPSGSITQIQNQLGLSRNFTYDDNQQLVTASNPEASVSSQMQSETFNYDSIYNRTTDQRGSYSYDPKKQRLNEDWQYLYYYDNNGNLFKKQAKANFPNSDVTNFFYSSENQLVGFKVYPNGSNSNPSKEVFYTYDVSGHRLQKRVIDHTAETDPLKTFTRRYVYDGDEIKFEYGENNELLAHYTHSNLRTDDVLAVDVTTDGVTAGLAQSSGSFQYLKDHQGSITDITDNSGNKLMHYVYSAFGVITGIQDANAQELTRESAPLRTSYTYTGREFDSESGYFYYRARYYDPNTSRFLQQDPDPGKLDLSVSVVNKYSYAGNSPQMYTDPTGKFFWLIAAFALLGAVQNFVEAINVPGATWWQILGSTLFGAVAGTLNAVTAIYGGFAAGIVSNFLSSGVNNAVNQALFTGKVDFGQAFSAGLLSSASGIATGFASSAVFGKTLTVVGTNVAANTFGQLAAFTPAFSYLIPSGIPTSDPPKQGCSVNSGGGVCTAEAR